MSWDFVLTGSPPLHRKLGQNTNFTDFFSLGVLALGLGGTPPTPHRSCWEKIPTFTGFFIAPLLFMIKVLVLHYKYSYQMPRVKRRKTG